MRILSSAVAVSTAALAVAMTQSGNAHATYRLFHAAQCAGTHDVRYSYGSTGQVSNDPSGEVNVDTTMICPVTTDGNFAPPATATISVDGYSRARSSGVSGFTAAACRVFRVGGGTGGSCGTIVRGSAAGAVAHLAPSAAGIWTTTSAADARFISVGFGPTLGGLDTATDVVWSYKVTY
jgi:hypothetical protein